MKKTKIICTLGPNANDRAFIKKLVESGMDIARFNFSHGTHEEQQKRMELLKSVRDELNVPIAILLDTKGPEIRTGLLKNGEKVWLQENQIFTLTTKEIIGDATTVSMNYAGLAEDVKIGKRILIDDGLIELEVKQITGNDIVCRVVNGGELGQRKGVNVPGVQVRLPALTEKDKEDILFGIEQGVDFIAASFVRNAETIKEIKSLLHDKKAPYIPIIAKIENAEGICNIDEILECADGVMVARGDLGVEIPVQEIPHYQKWLIQKCNECNKPVITATQMLDSMIRNPRPTRAEVTDVANAVYDGTDAVMLSGETAQGKYPVESLRMMVEVVKNAEEYLDYEHLLHTTQKKQKTGISDAIAYASVATAAELDAKCIITPTASGATARVVSKFRPKAWIVGVSPNEETLRRMQILRGVYPVKSIPCSTSEEMSREAIQLAKEKRMVASGDTVIVIAGIPSPNVELQQGGMSNMMQIAIVDEKNGL